MCSSTFVDLAHLLHLSRSHTAFHIFRLGFICHKQCSIGTRCDGIARNKINAGRHQHAVGLWLTESKRKLEADTRCNVVHTFPQATSWWTSTFYSHTSTQCTFARHLQLPTRPRLRLWIRQSSGSLARLIMELVLHPPQLQPLLLILLPWTSMFNTPEMLMSRRLS